MSSAPTNSSSSCALSSSSSYGVDLFNHMLDMLDYHVGLLALKELCATMPGKETVRRRSSRPSTEDNNNSDNCDHHWRTWRCRTNTFESLWRDHCFPRRRRLMWTQAVDTTGAVVTKHAVCAVVVSTDVTGIMVGALNPRRKSIKSSHMMRLR